MKTMKKIFQFLFCIIGGLPMAFFMAIGDKPLEANETYGKRIKEFLKQLPKLLKELWNQLDEE